MPWFVSRSASQARALPGGTQGNERRQASGAISLHLGTRPPTAGSRPVFSRPEVRGRPTDEPLSSGVARVRRTRSIARPVLGGSSVLVRGRSPRCCRTLSETMGSLRGLRQRPEHRRPSRRRPRPGGVDLSAVAIRQRGDLRPDLRDRLHVGSVAARPPDAQYLLVIGIPVFPPGDRRAAHAVIAAALRRISPSGRFCLRANAVGREPAFPPASVERATDGTETRRYRAGPKRGLPIHFFGDRFRRPFPRNLSTGPIVAPSRDTRGVGATLGSVGSDPAAPPTGPEAR